jgi:hypothetical protein
MAFHPAEKFFTRHNGPFAITAGCNLCKHIDIVRKERNPGRGWGMREGNKQRGRMIQHVKAEHPDVLTKKNAPE